MEIKDIEEIVKGNSNNSTVYIYNAQENQMVIDVKYQEKGQLVCMYDNSIHMIYQENDSTFTEFNEDTEIADINLKSNTVRVEEINVGLFKSKTKVILKNILTEVETTYEVNSSMKDLTCYNQIVAVNLGTEVHFINLNGWLEKKYVSKQEPKEIVLGTSVAGIVYRDRIKVLSI